MMSSGHPLIGHSALEGGDPPMGVAVGRFWPVSAYETIQSEVVAAFDSPQDHFAFVVVDTETGSSLPAPSGELGPEGMEVHVLGIEHPRYEQLLPGRYAAYEASFSKAR